MLNEIRLKRQDKFHLSDRPSFAEFPHSLTGLVSPIEFNFKFECRCLCIDDKNLSEINHYDEFWFPNIFLSNFWCQMRNISLFLMYIRKAFFLLTKKETFTFTNTCNEIRGSEVPKTSSSVPTVWSEQLVYTNIYWTQTVVGIVSFNEICAGFLSVLSGHSDVF